MPSNNQRSSILRRTPKDPSPDGTTQHVVLPTDIEPTGGRLRKNKRKGSETSVRRRSRSQSKSAKKGKGQSGRFSTASTTDSDQSSRTSLRKYFRSKSRGARETVGSVRSTAALSPESKRIQKRTMCILVGLVVTLTLLAISAVLWWQWEALKRQIRKANPLPTTTIGVIVNDKQASYPCGHTSADIIRSETFSNENFYYSQNKTHFPWAVKIKIIPQEQTDAIRYCSGTIINDRWILTAARCVIVPEGTEKPIISVAVGPTAEEYKDADLAISPGWDHNDSYVTVNNKCNLNDIALLKMTEPISDFTDGIRPVCLPTRPLDPYNHEIFGECVLLGFRLLRQDGPEQNRLRFRPVRVNDSYECATLERRYDEDFENNELICGQYDNRFITCDGDDGGALVCYNKKTQVWHQHGVIIEPTYKLSCAAEFPVECFNPPYLNPRRCCLHRGETRLYNVNLYTQVLHYNHWIHRQIMVDG